MPFCAQSACSLLFILREASLMSVFPAQKRRKPALVPENATSIGCPGCARWKRRIASRVSG